MTAVDMHVNHRRIDPFMPEYLLNRENIHAVAVKLGGGVVPQQMRGQPPGLPGQVRGHRLGQAGAQRVVGDRTAGPVAVPPLRVTVLSAVLPSMKTTLPVGVPIPGLTTLTVAVNITLWPNTDGFVAEVNPVLLLALPTTWLTVAEVLPAKLPSPP